MSCSDLLRPVAVNYHLLRACNLRCSFCFATFRDVDGQLAFDDARRVIDALADAGAEKLNFAGGEPTLYPRLGELLAFAKSRRLTTSIVTNGARLSALLDAHAGVLDWVGLSVDSSDEEVQRRLGRGDGGHVAASINLSERCRALGVRVKLNTVVTARTWDEDMAPLVRRVRPERWKVFQVLAMDGQNDGKVTPLLVTNAQFQTFLSRHAHLVAEGLGPVAEDNDAMRGSYVMVDPLGRFFGNATGAHVYSRPILQVGVRAALAEVGFSQAKFEARGGRYLWERQ